MSDSSPEVAFLLDVDNTLLDDDAIVEDFRQHLVEASGVAGERRYWELFEEHWDERGFADYLGTLGRWALEQTRGPRLQEAGLFLLQYPFATRVHQGAFELIARLRRRGRVVILSDGDVIYQPWKVVRAGLHDAVDGHVLISVHKERELDEIERRYPARRYVMVDDKVRVLAAMKAGWGARVTTVFVRQGRYARDPAALTAPPADITVDAIGDLITLTGQL